MLMTALFLPQCSLSNAGAGTGCAGHGEPSRPLVKGQTPVTASTFDALPPLYNEPRPALRHRRIAMAATAFIDFNELKTRVGISQVMQMLDLRMKQHGAQYRGACPACQSGG